VRRGELISLGGATLLRAGALGDQDPLEDIFFLYLEDAELGWKLRHLGFKDRLCPLGGGVA